MKTMAKKNNRQPVATGTLSKNYNTGVVTQTRTPTKYSLAGVGSNLSSREAQRIANDRGTSVGKIMDKAMGKGLTIGSGLVNKYNSGQFSSPRERFWSSVGQGIFGTKGFNSLTGVSNNMAGLSGLKLNSGQVYGGSYMRDGQLTPLVGMKGMGAGGGGKNSTTETTTTTSNTGTNGYTPEELTPTPTPTQTAPEAAAANSVDASFSPGGTGAMLDGGAISFRKAKSKARTAGLTTKGTSQFKISGQTGTSSGLNIGYSRMLGS
jgi:hypothetical protein